MRLIVFGFILLVIDSMIAGDWIWNGLFGWVLRDTLFFFVFPVLALGLLKIPLTGVGLTSRNWKTSLRYAGIMVVLAFPIMVYGSGLPEFKSYYPVWQPARENLYYLPLLWGAMLILMFVLEFFFRGFLLFRLERVFGRVPAIVIQAIPYTLIHIGKPGLEVPYSFFVGLVFGYAALKTRSMLPGFFAHWSSAVIFDLLILIRLS